MLDTKSGAALVAPVFFQETVMKQTTVKTVRAFSIGGTVVKPGTVATYDHAFAAELIANGKAVAHNEPVKSEPAKKAER